MAEKLGEYLIRKGTITQAQLQEALRTQQFFGGNLGSHLIQLGYIDEDDLGRALSKVTGAPYAGREALRRPEPTAVSALPADFVRKHRVLPFRLERGELHLAMQNPRDALGLHEASFLTSLHVVPYVAPEFRILQAIEKHYHIRLERRHGIQVRGGLGPTPVEPKRSSPSPPIPTPPSTPEIGLDGRPLDDPVDSDQLLDNPPPVPEAPAEVPRNLREWRKETTTGTRSAPGTGRVVPARPADHLIEAGRGIAEARDRDDIARVALDCLSARYRRAALFSVQKDQAVGWNGTGPDFHSARIRQVQVDLQAPSIFRTVLDGKSIYFGPVPDLPANQDLFTYLGGRLPSAVLVVPVQIKGKIVALLYADNAEAPLPPPDLVLVRRLAAKVALGLEALILRNKVLMV